MVSIPCQGDNHHSSSDFYKNLLLFVIINLKIPTRWWCLILQLSPWGLHKWCSQVRGGWSPIFFLLPFSIFPPFSRSFQVNRLLPAYNLNWWSFWGIYLTTSDPEHKEHTYFSYLLCLRKLFKKNFLFRLFLKFWTEVEEYLLKNIVFIFECPPPWLMVYVPTPLSLVLPRSLLPSHLPQFWPVHGGSAVMEMSLGGREITLEAPCCFQDHRDQGSREDSVDLAQLRGATQRNSTGLPLCRVCSQLPKFPTLGCWDTSITASYSFEGKTNVSFCTLTSKFRQPN